ncbi:unnamed protein product [Musa acuminata subsp. burmannicoides]
MMHAINNIGVFPLVVNFWSPNYYGSHSQDHHIMFAVIHYRSACSVNNVDCSTAMKDISTPALMSHFKRLAYTLMVVDIADLSFEEAVLHSEATEKILGVRIYCGVRLNHPREMSGVTWSPLNGLLHRGPDYVPQCDPRVREAAPPTQPAKWILDRARISLPAATVQIRPGRLCGHIRRSSLDGADLLLGVLTRYETKRERIREDLARIADSNG